MFESDRTCCVCNIRGKQVQIHHIDENPANNIIGNLSVLCFDCHNDTMIKGGFGRKLDSAQILLYRSSWLNKVKQQRIGIFGVADTVETSSNNQLNSVRHPISVYEKTGDIFIKFSDGDEKRLPHTGNDSYPILHVKTQKIAFLRETDNGKEIFVYNIILNTLECIVSPKDDKTIENRLTNMMDLIFSPDGQFLYFTSRAWVVTRALHRYDFTNKSEKFVCDGNSIEVIKYGKFKGFLVVSKHKYKGAHIGYGSYDHYWLLTDDGKEVVDLGRDLDGVQNYLKHTMVY